MVNIDVLTYACGYNFNIYERFVLSLKNTGFNGKIYIIIKIEDKNKIDKLLKTYKNVVNLIDDLKSFTNPNNHRYFVYSKYLEQIKGEYILLTDFRDVLFYKNIEHYNYDPSVDIYGFLEGKTIKDDQKFNTPWLKLVEKITNKEFYDNICNEYIICSGTTLGKKNAINTYVEVMCEHLSKIGKYHKVILDQGYHNYIFYTNLLNLNIKLLSNHNKECLVNTVGRKVEQFYDDDYNIVNKNNVIPYVVHQYDRFPSKLQKKFLNRLSLI